MRHHVLPGVGREDHGKAVEAPHAVAAVLRVQVHDLARDLGIGEVLATHREIRDVLRSERIAQSVALRDDVALDRFEAAASRHALVVDPLGLGDLGRLARQDLDAGADAAADRDAGCSPPQQGRCDQGAAALPRRERAPVRSIRALPIRGRNHLEAPSCHCRCGALMISLASPASTLSLGFALALACA
jgi:hypothetical protein